MLLTQRLQLFSLVLV